MTDCIRMGLDVGTKTIICANRDEEGKLRFRQEINGFFIFPKQDAFTKNILVQQKIPFIERDGKFIALGSKAEKFAYAINSTLLRPMAEGTISQEEEAITIMASIVQALIGKPEKDVILYYCIPAEAINKSTNVKFHDRVVRMIFDSYKRTNVKIKSFSVNEARAIAVASNQPIAIAISFGAGMVNVCYNMHGFQAFEFSIVGCLSPEFPVITENGVKQIKDVKPGDMVVGDDGLLVEVSDVVNNGRRDNMFELSLDCLPAFKYKLTYNHRVWVKNGYRWEWKNCGNIEAGDVVGTPIVRYSGHNEFYFGYDKTNQRVIKTQKSRSLGKFLGYFLGDGNVFLNKKRGLTGYVGLSFNSDDIELINEYCDMIVEKFGQKPSREVRGDTRLTKLNLNNSFIARCLNDFYDSDGAKCLPMPVSEIPDQMAVGLIEGLIDSDGHATKQKWEGGYEITNSSIHIVVLVHHLLNRLGIRHSIGKRSPRNGGINSRGVQIVGKKDSYVISVNSFESAILNVLFRFNETGLPIQYHDFAVYRVRSNDIVPYDGDVYDLIVKSSHRSFSTFGMVVHNSGDWIDVESAKQFGYDPENTSHKSRETPTSICQRKQLLDLNKPLKELDRVDQAIVMHYQLLIENVIDGIVRGFNDNSDRARIDDAVPIVIAGGTASPAGFKEYFEKILASRQLPFKVSGVTVMERPLYTVAEGCLLAAEMHAEE